MKRKEGEPAWLEAVAFWIAATAGKGTNMGTTTSAIEMAHAVGISPKRFRSALRREKLPWHQHNDRWTVETGSAEHEAMKRVLLRLSR